MDGRRFDDLVRALATVPPTRRRMLRLLTGGAASALAGALGLRGAGAQTGPGGSTCANNGQSCSAQKFCDGFTCLEDLTSGTEKFCCPNNDVCRQCCVPTRGLCLNGECRCPVGEERCRNAGDPIGTCFDLLTSVANCGECGNACAGGQECIGGVCVCTPASCPDGCCDGNQCRPGTANGACGIGGVACVTCPNGTGCQNGTCVCTPASCPTGCCDGNVCRGGSSNTNCGSGGATCVACTGNRVCCGGACKLPVGAACSGNGNCCSNRCRSGVCAA